MNILVVDDEASMRNSLARLLTGGGHSVRVADCAHEGLACARKEHPDLVLLDIRLPDTSGLEVLTRLKQMNHKVVVIVMTAYESTRDAVLAMKRGAYDYLTKPFNIDAVRQLVRQAFETRPVARETDAVACATACLQAVPEPRLNKPAVPHTSGGEGSVCERMIGASPAMQKVLDIIDRLRVLRPTGLPAHAISNVLIEGETGTGKELVARAIHETNDRASGPFVAISCGAIPRELMESELFGYDRGAFTGARREGKQGAFERAGAGTIFLDEIGELELGLQVKLLRVLEAREFSRVGGLKDVRLRARVIAATNRDLRREVDRGRFRADLYFRLDVIRVGLPPLRERGEDIILLAEAFLREFNARFDKNFKTISPPARKLLTSYAWPGNIRELRNIMERIVFLETGETISPEALTTYLTATSFAREDTEDTEGDDSAVPCRLPCRLVSVSSVARGSRPEGGEKEQIAEALERTGGNVVRAARMLGLGRGALRYRMKKLGVAEDRPHSPPFCRSAD